METKICESCGMPMKNLEDFGGQNPENKYCKYCTYEDGKLKSFDEKVADFMNFMMKTQDLGQEQASRLARENLLKMPAWKHLNIG